MEFKHIIMIIGMLLCLGIVLSLGLMLFYAWMYEIVKCAQSKEEYNNEIQRTSHKKRKP